MMRPRWITNCPSDADLLYEFRPWTNKSRPMWLNWVMEKSAAREACLPSCLTPKTKGKEENQCHKNKGGKGSSKEACFPSYSILKIKIVTKLRINHAGWSDSQSAFYLLFFFHWITFQPWKFKNYTPNKEKEYLSIKGLATKSKSSPFLQCQYQHQQLVSYWHHFLHLPQHWFVFQCDFSAIWRCLLSVLVSTYKPQRLGTDRPAPQTRVHRTSGRPAGDIQFYSLEKPL